VYLLERSDGDIIEEHTQRKLWDEWWKNAIATPEPYICITSPEFDVWFDEVLGAYVWQLEGEWF